MFNGTKIWTKIVGGGNNEEGNSIFLDHANHRVYVAGMTSSASILGTSGSGSDDGFLLAYDMNGNYLWCRRFGSTSLEASAKITVIDGIIAISGRTSGSFNGQTKGSSTSGYFITYDCNGNMLDTTIDKSLLNSNFIDIIKPNNNQYALVSAYGSLVILAPRPSTSGVSTATCSISTLPSSISSKSLVTSSSRIFNISISSPAANVAVSQTGTTVVVGSQTGTDVVPLSVNPSSPPPPAPSDPIPEEVIVISLDAEGVVTSSSKVVTIGKNSGLARDGFFLTPLQLIGAFGGGAVFVLLLTGFAFTRYYIRQKSTQKSSSLGTTVQMQDSFTETNLRTSVSSTSGSQFNNRTSGFDPSLTSSGTTMVPTENGLSIPAYMKFEAVDFRAIKKLTQGGGGEIVLGEPMNKHLILDSNKIVIKYVFAGPGTRDADGVMFYQEVALMQYLSTCKNIAKLLGYVDSPPALLLKYYKFGSLREWVATKGWRTKPVLLNFTSDISKGLMFMHSKSLVHADIKPGNVLIDEDEYGMLYCVITDFGITCIYDDSLMLVKGFVKAELQGASLAYAAPEAILRFRSDISTSTVPYQEAAAIDVYALSIIMYELLAIKAWSTKNTVSHASLAQISVKTATKTATSIKDFSADNSRTALNQ